MKILTKNEGSRTHIEFKKTKKEEQTVKTGIKRANTQMPNDVLEKHKDINIGFEFEFNVLNGQTEPLLRTLGDSIHKISFCPEDYNIQDKNLNVWTMERDGTLVNPTKNGFEIVSPKLPLVEAMYHLENTLNIIQEYGETNNACGLHFHISSESEKKKDFDVVKLMLLLKEKEVFSEWKNRSDCNIELEDIFNKTSPDEFKKGFPELSRFYSVIGRHKYKIPNHLEVRAMGGEGYEFKASEIKKDFIDFIDAYVSSCDKTKDLEKYQSLKEKFISENENSFKKPIELSDVIRHARNKIDIDSLNETDYREILESSIFEIEDKKETLVPIRNLLNELEEHIQEVFCEEENNLNYTM